MFKMTGMHHLFRPFERCRVLLASLRKIVYGLAHSANRGCAQATQGLPPQNAKPAFHLIEPGGMSGSVVKVDIGVTGQPTIMLGLMDVQVVQDDMQLLARVLCHYAIHEIQKLPPPSSAVVAGGYQSCHHLQGGKQGGGTMSLVFMAEPSQGV